jgi:hypothetical protein
MDTIQKQKLRREYCHRNYLKHRKHVLKRTRQWAINHPEKVLKAARKWRRNHPEKAKASTKRWRSLNPERRLAQKKRWYLKNHKMIREYWKQFNANKKPSVNQRLNNRMRALLNYSLRNGKGGRRWEELVGYTLFELKQHLESQFADNMNWEIFMRGKGEIHIDHIIPRSAFRFNSPEDQGFKDCWALKNLQPLWAKDNLSKGSKCNLMKAS